MAMREFMKNGSAPSGEIVPIDEEILPSGEVMFASIEETHTVESEYKGDDLPSNPYKLDENGRVTIDDDTILIDKDENIVDDILDTDKLPLENFITELEQKMVNGAPAIRTRIWARRQYGINSEQLTRYKTAIQATWKLEGTTVFVAQQRRAELRQYYMEIYREAMADGDTDERNLALALKTVDAMAKLDGLVMPDIAVSITNNGSSETKQELTNKVRERTQLLLQTMRERAEKHAAIATRAIVEKKAEMKRESLLEFPSTAMMEKIK